MLCPAELCVFSSIPPTTCCFPSPWFSRSGSEEVSDPCLSLFVVAFVLPSCYLFHSLCCLSCFLVFTVLLSVIFDFLVFFFFCLFVCFTKGRRGEKCMMLIISHVKSVRYAFLLELLMV